jgi:hypothetical protein
MTEDQLQLLRRASFWLRMIVPVTAIDPDETTFKFTIQSKGNPRPESVSVCLAHDLAALEALENEMGGTLSAQGFEREDSYAG